MGRRSHCGEKKKHELVESDRYYQGSHPIKNTVVVQQKSYPEKLIVIDEIGFDHGVEYRVGYWVVSDKKLEKGEISVVFGQFASVIPPEDFQKIIQKAKEHDWDGPGPV